MSSVATSFTFFEQEARQQGYQHIAGIDEAGRGPLAGPVVAAACVLAPDLTIDGVNDSKKLTPRQRDQLFDVITTHPDIHYDIGIVDAAKVDEVNILQATILAMMQAVDQLESVPDFLLIDGRINLPHVIPSQDIVKGDQRSQSIAAASIIAKVTRDRMMLDYDQQWPQYGFKAHKGYGTAKHRQAIMEHGPCSIHRMTFEPLKSSFS